jgi:surface antigen
MSVKSVAAGIIIVGLGMGSLAGCAAIEEETGIGQKAQVGAAGGATFGGVVAAVAGASPAWIAASVILGGLTGGVIGDYFDQRDREYHAQSSYQAFQTQGPGGQTTWNNPQTGDSGMTRIDGTFVNAQGQQCKNFTQTLNVHGEAHMVDGVACEQADGTWKVVST